MEALIIRPWLILGLVALAGCTSSHIAEPVDLPVESDAGIELVVADAATQPPVTDTDSGVTPIVQPDPMPPAPVTLPELDADGCLGALRHGCEGLQTCFGLLGAAGDECIAYLDAHPTELAAICEDYLRSQMLAGDSDACWLNETSGTDVQMCVPAECNTALIPPMVAFVATQSAEVFGNIIDVLVAGCDVPSDACLTL